MTIYLDDHWLGLDITYLLTMDDNYNLMIEVWDDKGQFYVSMYDNFKVADPNEKYSLRIGQQMQGENYCPRFQP